MLYSVETQIPVELIDIVERQRRLLELRPRSPDQELVPKRLVDNLLDATWNRWPLDLQLGLEPGNRIAQAIAASEARRQIPPAIAVSMEIGAIQGGSVIGTQIGKYQSVDLNIESAAPQHLDSILWRIESYKRGLSPIALQPGDSVVKQFIFRTRSWLLFTPLAHNMQIQVRYSVDNRDHLDTVPFQLTIQAAITATMTGAVIGGLTGGVARSLSGRQDQAAMDGGGTGPVSIVLAMMLSAIVVVSFARKSGVQQVVSVEDFWGGLFIGFLIGFWGQSFALNLLAPSQGTTSTP